jgi:hypothetical protein
MRFEVKAVTLEAITTKGRNKIRDYGSQWKVMGIHGKMDPYYFNKPHEPRMYLIPQKYQTPVNKGAMWIRQTGDKDFEWSETFS